MRTWKFVLLIIILSFLVAPLVSLSETLIPLVLVGVLIYFPGNGAIPRLIRWLPFIWGLSFFESILILIDAIAGIKMFPPELYAIIKMNEIILTLVFAPALIWTYFKKQGLFKWLFYTNMTISILLCIYNFSTESITTKSWIDLFAGMLTDLILIIYFQKKLFLRAAT